MHSRPNLAEKYGIAAYSKQATTTTKQYVMCAKPCAVELFLGLLCFAVFLILGSFAGKLWRRKEITPTFPEGTEWLYIMDGFSHVTLGFRNDVSFYANFPKEYFFVNCNIDVFKCVKIPARV